MASSARPALMKILAFWLLFLILHFAYEWLPVPLVAVFSGVSEAFLQHAKIGFIAYSLVAAGEYFVTRARITNRGGFFFSRLLTGLIMPWVMFVMWYFAPNFIGRWPTDLAEIIYANITLLLMITALLVLEREFEALRFSRPARVLIVGLYVLALAHMVAFTFREPWAGFFVER